MEAKISLVVAVIALAAGASTSLAAPPNIVYIISDDQAFSDFGFMGNEDVHTPHLDALAAESARFVNGYVPTSVCRPSLATLLTGLYPHQHGIHFNHGPPGNAGYNALTSAAEYRRLRQREFELIKQCATLPGELDRRYGYRSLQTGKFWEGHWRNGGFTEGMTQFQTPPAEQTFGGVRVLASGERVAHGNGDVGLQIGRRTMAPIKTFIRECHRSATPWFVWYAPYLPHQPHDSPEWFYELARRRPGVAENELPYYASIAQFDETVGELIDFVDDEGLAEQTLIVFVVDNGWSASQRRQPNRPSEFAHTARSKRAPFEDGVRTPILLRWPGVIEPATHMELVSSVDLMPTVLAAAEFGSSGGLSSAENGGRVLATGEPSLPGESLFSAARGETQLSQQRAVFGEIYPGDATRLNTPARDVAYRWVREGDLKLIVPHSHPPDGAPWGRYLDSVALFDLASDPEESKNLVESPHYRGVVARLRARLDGWWSPDFKSN